jgi:hypothetical protein
MNTQGLLQRATHRDLLLLALHILRNIDAKLDRLNRANLLRVDATSQPEETPMASKHSVHKSTETGNFVVADDKGNILHSFPSEGEANLQVIALEQAEQEAKAEAKVEAKAGKDDNNDKPDKPHVGASARHR